MIDARYYTLLVKFKGKLHIVWGIRAVPSSMRSTVRLVRMSCGDVIAGGPVCLCVCRSREGPAPISLSVMRPVEVCILFPVVGAVGLWRHSRHVVSMLCRRRERLPAPKFRGVCSKYRYREIPYMYYDCRTIGSEVVKFKTVVFVSFVDWCIK